MTAVRACVIMLMALLMGLPARGMADEASFAQGARLYRAGQYERAAAALTEYLSQQGAGKSAAEALHTLATMYESRGRPAEAADALRRLVEDHPASPWSLNGLARLARGAAAGADFERAARYTSQFLDLYLAGEHATVDDPVCRGMFDLLVSCVSKASPGVAVRAVHRTLKERYPVPSATGRVVDYWTGVDPADPEANLVLNPSFELDGRAIGTPVGWHYIGSEPNLGDDIDGALPSGAYIREIRARTGTYAAGKFTSWGVHRGWLYQRVPVLAGKRYEVSAWGLTPAPDEGSKPGQLRVGADPAGGTHPGDGTVVWSDPVSPQTDYELISLSGDRAVTAKGQYITVYLELRHDEPTPPNAMLFDDAAVRQVK